ncbi:MAG: AIPR family protein [Deltaproteobacteria bacterium]|nr:AIPR family protein [Deltaproteobacteria bacterium]
MGQSVHRIRVLEARKISHPTFPEISKYWLSVAARDFPCGISTAVNARDPVGLNRRIYRDVKESLEGKTAVPGTFDLMNKGITILALDVKLIDKDKNLYEITVDDEIGGIVDGAHTAQIICEAQDAGTIPQEQHVEVYVRTNIAGRLITDIARGLNTSLQVAPKSIYNIDGVFDWLKELIAVEPYADLFSWKESDSTEYDVRDLVGVLELLNIFDFPNPQGKHPISAYEKWSLVLDRFAADMEANRGHLVESKYYRLRNLLPGGLALYDYVRRDFRDMHNVSGGSAGKMNILEMASAKRGSFEFPFAQLEPCEYRLTKGAAFPILAAFRNYVEVDPDTGEAVWRGGIEAVLREWEEAGPELVAETAQATKEIGRNPDQIGKNRKHWDNLHMKLQLRVLRSELLSQRAAVNPRSR